MQEKAGREAGGDRRRLFCSEKARADCWGGCGRELPQKQRKGGSSKDSAGHVSFELDSRDKLAMLRSLPKQLREICCVQS